MLDYMCEIIESKIMSVVVEMVLDCGMFFSFLGLYVVLFDVYFFFVDGMWILVEIKCLYNY